MLGWNQVTGEGISIFTTSNNYGRVLHLLGILPKNCISPYYQIIPKTVKQDMNRELYDRFILLNQDEVNKQRYINITNVTPDLFQSMINFHLADTRSNPYEVTKFLQGPGKVLEIEPTIDTEERGTYQMLTTDKNHDITYNKLKELQTCLMTVKDTDPLMIASFKRFGNYIEVIGNQSTSVPTNDPVRQLESQVNNQMSPTQPRKQNRPDTLISLWDIPPNISMPTASSLTPATPKTYKSVTQNVNQRQSAVHTM